MNMMNNWDKDPFEVASKLFKEGELEGIPFEILSVQLAQQLKQRGFFIINDFIPPATVAAIRKSVFPDGTNRNEAFKWTRPEPPDVSSSYPALCTFAAHTASYISACLSLQARGDYIGWIHPAHPPANQPPWEALMLQIDSLGCELDMILKLNGESEYQLAHYPGAGTGYKRHRDALLDDGSAAGQRRVTCITYLSNKWEPAHAGQLRIWGHTMVRPIVLHRLA
jgi:Rps23 Pro-64 3,4-dihydroxylase Tpa1-like proline 4-hydroxylase